MKKLIILFFVAFAFTNCKNNVENKEEMQPNFVEESASTLEKGCYIFNDDKTKIKFEIKNAENPVTGNLDYALYEKDANKGTFRGKMNDDILFGDYTFNSEGSQSTREITFKIVDNKLIEGYGEMNKEGNAFKDKNAIKYTSSMPLKKTDCNK